MTSLEQPQTIDSSSEKVKSNWVTNKRLVRSWDMGVKSAPVSLVYSLVVFQSDSRQMYRHMDGLKSLPSGTRVLDIPSGGGVLLRARTPDDGLHYTAADISPLMLERVRAEGKRRKLPNVVTEESDAGALPFSDDSFDVVASYSGLHCVPDPQAALAEIARVLVPGGRLRGSVVVTGATPIADLFIKVWQHAHILDKLTDGPAFLGWIREAGFVITETSTSGALLYFDATLA